MPDPVRFRRLETLFAEALDRPPDARAAFVHGATDDLALAADVLALLDADARAADAWGDDATAWSAPLLADPEHRPGDRIGAYCLDAFVGRGGVGSVWRARRDDAPDVPIALKVLRRGLDTADVRHRFRQEQRLLDRLDHPSIARLVDGGVTDDGLPFVAMDYVQGTAIDAYCDARRLGLDARLRLFAHVCDTVHYAHQHLVVHRDLKPANILVADGPDGQPRATLLDFGIAKALEPDALGLTTLLTRSEQRLLTPAYASPEQRAGQAVTTASDVYSLGVLLCELLSGHRPLAGSDGEPLRPSQAVDRPRTDAHDGGPVTPSDLAAARGLTPDRLRRALRGDLDTIVRMALRREPERRYASAAQFADDVRRHLDGRPVHARPSTAAYRFRSFVRRHRAGVALAALAVLALVGIAVATTVERNRTAREAAKAQAVAGVLAGLFDAANPMVSNGDTLTVYDVLTGSEARLRRELANQPEVLADVLGVMGRAYRDQTHLARADTVLRDALALHERVHPRSAATADALGDLATRHFMANDLDAARALAHRWLALERDLHGARDLRLLAPLARLATVHLQAGDLDSARAVLDRGLTLADDDPEARLRMLGLDGWYHATRGNHALAAHVAREILALHRRTGGALADIALAERILGDQCLRSGDFACAAASLDSARVHYRAVFGPGSRYEALVDAHRAELAVQTAPPADALRALSGAYTHVVRHFGPTSSDARRLAYLRDSLAARPARPR